MTRMTLRRALRVALATTALAAAAPAVASASTWTVDDDHVQCPNAGYTSIQAAVNQAAPWDTVVVCAGTYPESSIPTNNANSPVQAGARNGLTIAKPLTIKGAGADKVFIQPADALGPSLAGTAPYLRDGGGNVITISRQSLGSTDDNENFVDISGVTVRSPTIYAEAGIAFFNTSGRIANSVVGPLKRAATDADYAAMPHGWGVIMTNSLQGAEAGVRREVTIDHSLVTGYQTGGVLFDDARGTDGNATNTTRSGIKAYGFVTASRIIGAGSGVPTGTVRVAQTGVRYAAGQRGAVTGSEIAANIYPPDPRRSVGLLLTDAETGPDPANPSVRAFTATGNAFAANGYGVFNADIANAAVRTGAPALVGPGTWWGCGPGPVVGFPSSGDGCQGVSGPDSGSAPSLQGLAPFATAPLAPISVPGVVVDAPPTASFVHPLDGTEVAVGQSIDPVVLAGDDFGVRSVAVTADGAPVATIGHAPYELSWAPTAADYGHTVALVATATDSSGQTATDTLHVHVPVPDAYRPIVADPPAWNAGWHRLGNHASTPITITNTGDNPLALGSIGIDGSDWSISDATCTPGATLAIGASCTVTVWFAPTFGGTMTGELSVDYDTPGASGPLVVSLVGSGVAPEPDAGDAGAASPSASAASSDPGAAAPAPPEPPATSTPEPPATGASTGGIPLGDSAVVDPREKLGKPTKAGKLTVGSVSCGDEPCTIKVSGTLKVGRRTFRVSATKRLAAGASTTMSVTLPEDARAALAKAGKGTLTLTYSAGGETMRESWTMTGRR